MPNKIFSFPRFINLIANDFLINHKRYALFVAGMFILPYLALSIAMYNDYPHWDIFDYLPFFVFSMAAIIIFITGGAFPEFNTKIQTANYILLPASVFEKFVVQFLLRIVVPIGLFLLIFWIDARLAKHTVSSIKSNYFVLVDGEMLVVEDLNYLKLFYIGEVLSRDVWAAIAGIFSSITFFFSCRLYFKRFAPIKTLIAATILIFLFVCSFVFLSHIFYPETVGFDIKLQDYHICENLYNIQLYIYILAYVSWIFFLFVGFFKLKEKRE